MIDYKKLIDKIFVVLEIIAVFIGLTFGIGIILVCSNKLHFEFISSINNIVSEYKTTNNITGNNITNLVFLILIIGGFALLAATIPYIINLAKIILRKEGFDEWDELIDKDAKNQIVLIAGIKGLLQQYKGTPLFDNIEKLFYLFDPKIAKSSGLLSSARIAVPPQMEFTINTNNWEKILRAMEQNKKIRTRYVAPYKDSESQRVLWPYQILLDNGTVYLMWDNSNI